MEEKPKPFVREEIPPPVKQLTFVHVSNDETDEESSPPSSPTKVWVTFRDMHRWRQLLPLLQHIESHFQHHELEFTVDTIDRALKALYEKDRPMLVDRPKLSSPKEK